MSSEVRKLFHGTEKVLYCVHDIYKLFTEIISFSYKTNQLNENYNIIFFRCSQIWLGNKSYDLRYLIITEFFLVLVIYYTPNEIYLMMFQLILAASESNQGNFLYPKKST